MLCDRTCEGAFVMFANALKYELKQSIRPFALLSGIALAFALSARTGFFSLTDMPLFYVAFFGTVGMIVYRFYRTMFGQESVFMFSVAISASAQIMLRLLAGLILSICSTVVIGIALIIQGEEMGELLMSLSSGIGCVLFVEAALSAFLLSVILGAILTLSNLPLCRNERTMWMVLWAIVIFGAIVMLSTLTEEFIDIYLIIQLSGGVFIAHTHAVPSSFAFSINMLMWQVIVTPVLIVLMYRLTKKYQILT